MTELIRNNESILVLAQKSFIKKYQAFFLGNNAQNCSVICWSDGVEIEKFHKFFNEQVSSYIVQQVPRLGNNFDTYFDVKKIFHFIQE